ncbi:MAG TPA: response regulator, partial [Limnobacter sp.]|nr:response regulator [Limnobacter sp.]
MMKKVLLVDESHSIRTTYAEVVRQAGFTAETVASAKEALQHIVEHGTPDLIITEINLPGLGGLEFCRRVRSVSRNTPIFIISTQSDKEQIAEARQIGIQGWLLKPVQPELLL